MLPMLKERTRHYLLIDLESAPDVLARLLAEVRDPAVLDHRPDPDRFSLREMAAHLADWESVFLGRLTQTRDEENATLQGLDEGQVALNHDYAHADLPECLARYRTGRAKIIAFLRALTPAQWERVGTHTEVGPLTMEEQLVLIAAHDGYHRQQTVCYVSAGEAKWEVRETE